MNYRPPHRSAPPIVEKKAAVATQDNALWRLDSWFPDLDPTTSALLRLYHSELLKFNGRLNLISRNTERDADEIHFADSILAAKLIHPGLVGKRVFDIGSGNGMPGVVVALLHSDCEVVLIESDGRKCEFLKHIAHVLALKNCSVMNVRLESLRNEQLETVLSRGFATISKSLLATNRFFAKGGRFYHMKGNHWSKEIAELPSQLISYWTPELVGEYSLPVSQARRSVILTHKIQA